eukprot:jgi/Botrbrau1/4954/Bobra.0122s0031.1
MADEALGGLTEAELVDDAEIDTLMRDAIVSTIGDSQFNQSKISTWSNNIVDTCLKRLAALGRPFKYVITCNLTQKAGAGLHVSSSSHWNTRTDGKMTVLWENQTLIVLATVYWVAA